MHYRVYSGPKGSPDVSPLEKSELLFKEFAALDDALSWARHLEGGGRVPLLIEGDDGTHMSRRAIIDELRGGMREQRDRYGRKAPAANPYPLGARARGEVVPLIADDVPIHHRALAAGGRGRHRIVGIIQVGRADREQNAKNNSDEDTHDETPRSRSQTQLTEMRFQRS